MAHAFNTSSQEAEADRSLESFRTTQRGGGIKVWAEDMSQQIKMSATNPKDLSSSPRTHSIK